jgi:hypothetical protein
VSLKEIAPLLQGRQTLKFGAYHMSDSQAEFTPQRFPINLKPSFDEPFPSLVMGYFPEDKKDEINPKNPNKEKEND